MPICVECGQAVSSLYTEYSKGNIRLTPCERCEQFADKYIEHDTVIIFIDMLLHKPQVYRHLLFNRMTFRDSGIDPNISRLAILLLLFDVYVKWFRLEKAYANEHDTPFPHHEKSLVFQYFYILSLCVLEFLAVQWAVRSLVGLWFSERSATIKFNYISTALIMSSFPKLLLILMIIWDYQDMLEWSWLLVNLLVMTSNAEALSVFLDAGHLPVLIILSAAFAVKCLVQAMIFNLDPAMTIWVF